MKSLYTSILVVVVTALTTTTTKVQAQVDVDTTTQCACAFDVDNEMDCYVYGNNPYIGDLVAYPRIQDECIRDIGAASAYIDALAFWIYCPFANHTGYNLEQFLILLQDETESQQAQDGTFCMP